MKQIRILLLAVLFATASFGHETVSVGGVPADMVNGQPSHLVSVDGSRLT